MHEYFHTRFGFCMWDAGALILLAAVVVILVVHTATDPDTDPTPPVQTRRGCFLSEYAQNIQN